MTPDCPDRSTPAETPGAEVVDIDRLIDAVLLASFVPVSLAARSVRALEEEVTLAQYRAMVVLASSGPENLTALAGALGVGLSTATRMCDRLLRKGLIRRRTARLDRREVRLALTEAGHGLVNEVTQQWRAELGSLLRDLPSQEQHVLIGALDHVNAAAGEVLDQHARAGHAVPGLRVPE